MFKEYKKDLGTVKPKDSINIEFPYEGHMHIKNVFATCDCTSVKWDNEIDGKITAVYKVKPVPHHLKMQGKTGYASKKHIKVLTNKEEITLTFTALVQE